jgi:hypothetical protein
MPRTGARGEVDHCRSQSRPVAGHERPGDRRGSTAKGRADCLAPSVARAGAGRALIDVSEVEVLVGGDARRIRFILVLPSKQLLRLDRSSSAYQPARSWW